MLNSLDMMDEGLGWPVGRQFKSPAGIKGIRGKYLIPYGHQQQPVCCILVIRQVLLTIIRGASESYKGQYPMQGLNRF
jgi:hypothetical protein